MNSLDGGSGFYVSTAKKRVLAVSGEPRVLAELKMRLKDFFDVGIAASSTAVTPFRACGADAVVIHIGEDSDAAFSDYKDISARTGGNIPILFLAENDGEALEAEALRLGAADYALMRPNGCDALASRIRLRMAERRTAPAEWLLSGKTILVAEDAELNREIIAAMLAAVTGLTVHFAENGSQAAEMFKNNPDGYSMVFMDIHMPVTDGLAATRAIRAMGLERSVSIPIIALSAADGEEEIEACSDAGMNGFLLKPMDYEEFLGVCGKFLG